MKAKRLKLFGIVVIVIACSVWFLRAREIAADTNWVGFLVTGQKEKGDPIAGNSPFPKADGQIEIGLRNDGVVVWRKAQAK
jgi:hypothetical protein